MSRQIEFDVTPRQDQLDELTRDFQFHPCGIAQPKVLTADQIEAFNRDGFLTGIRIFGEEEIANFRDYFNELLQRVLAEGGDSYSISTAHLKHGRAFDLLTHPRIVAFVTDLLGDDVIAWGSHFFCKMPHDGKQVTWHQDASYWPLSPSKTITVWLAIDDADVENACMQFIAGSHHYGHLAHRTSDRDARDLLGRTIDGAERYGRVINNTLRAGEISIHSDLLLHGSAANHSNRRRCGLTLRYCTADVRAALNWNLKGVIVSGRDSFGHWANPPRPAND